MSSDCFLAEHALDGLFSGRLQLKYSRKVPPGMQPNETELITFSALVSVQVHHCHLMVHHPFLVSPLWCDIQPICVP